MGVDVEDVYGTDIELLELARTSVSNAEYSLPWFFPQRFGDWEKASFHTRRAAQLLSQHAATEESVVSACMELDSIHALLKSAQDSLTARDYKKATASLKNAHQALTAYIAKGESVPEAVGKAKAFVTNALQHAYAIGAGEAFAAATSSVTVFAGTEGLTTRTSG